MICTLILSCGASRANSDSPWQIKSRGLIIGYHIPGIQMRLMWVWGGETSRIFLKLCGPPVFYWLRDWKSTFYCQSFHENLYFAYKTNRPKREAEVIGLTHILGADIRYIRSSTRPGLGNSLLTLWRCRCLQILPCIKLSPRPRRKAFLSFDTSPSAGSPQSRPNS